MASTILPVTDPLKYLNGTALLGLKPGSVLNAAEKVQAQHKQEENWTNQLGMNGDWFRTKLAEDGSAGRGSLAKSFVPTSEAKGFQNIVNDYPWTISDVKNRTDIPYIQLNEHKVEGGQIQKQVEFYSQGAEATLENFIGMGETDYSLLGVYREIFPVDPTGFRYKFPYFTKACYELTTSQWEQFDKISSSGGSIASGLKSMFGGKVVDVISGAIGAVAAGAETALAYKYPVTGIADRPRIFTGHHDRTVTIEFPLYNTLLPGSWVANKDLLQVFMSQNLFNKRNFITGLPPVWYQVFVPGQYFSVASCVTNINVTNLGNVRLEKNQGKEFIVPDAYQVSIQLTELAMPSKNQFHAALDGTAQMRVNSTTILASDQIPVKANEPPSSYPPLDVPIKEGTLTSQYKNRTPF